MAENKLDLARLLPELYRARNILRALPELEGLELAHDAALRDGALHGDAKLHLEERQRTFDACCHFYQESVIRLKNTTHWLIAAAERAGGVPFI